jgi:plasmid stabilization system protein ParE
MGRQEFQRELEEEIEDGVYSVLPRVLSVGLGEIDEKYLLKEEISAEDFVNILKKKKYKKDFRNYNEGIEREVPDLDNLINGVASAGAQAANENLKQIVPSLLVAFTLSQDSGLDAKLMDVLMRSFSQRSEMLKNLNELEILFDDDEIALYTLTHERVDTLRILNEHAEVRNLLQMYAT